MDDLQFKIFQLASDDYCCTQMILKMALDQEDKENIDLLKAANAFCGGVAFTGGICGVITGAVSVFGLYAGKGRADEYCSDNLETMSKHFINWFEIKYGSKNCRDIINSDFLEAESCERNYPTKCGTIVEKGFIKIWDILEENGYELGVREE